MLASARVRRWISVIVPIRNESPEIAEGFRRFTGLEEAELLIADGDPVSPAGRAFAASGARVIAGEGTRGARLARAAKEASGEVLLFLHADSRAPEEALALIRETLAGGADAGAFSLAYENAGPKMRWIAWWANARSRLFGLPFGDQGLFCRREAYERAGGFRDLPICDDLDLVCRLKRVGRLVVRPEKTFTSPRRYRERGTLRQVLRNWKVMFGYFAGVRPETLARWYNA